MRLKNNFVKFLPAFLVGLGFVVAFVMIQQSIGVSAQNNFYTRFQTCVLSVKPNVRSDSTIEDCYNKVEKETGVKAPRYEPKGY